MKKKKIVYRKDVEKMPNRSRGNTLLQEGLYFEKLYYEATTSVDENKYYSLMRIHMQLAAYDFGFNNVDDMYRYLDEKGGDCI